MDFFDLNSPTCFPWSLGGDFLIWDAVSDFLITSCTIASSIEVSGQEVHGVEGESCEFSVFREEKNERWKGACIYYLKIFITACRMPTL